MESHRLSRTVCEIGMKNDEPAELIFFKDMPQLTTVDRSLQFIFCEASHSFSGQHEERLPAAAL